MTSVTPFHCPSPRRRLRKKRRQQRRQSGGNSRGGPGLVEIGRLRRCQRPPATRKNAFAFRGAEGQAAADVVKQQAGALREQAPHQEGFQRHVAEPVVVLHGEQVENVAVQDEQRIGAAVPTPRQFQSPAAQRQARGRGWWGWTGAGAQAAERSPECEVRSPS